MGPAPSDRAFFLIPFRNRRPYGVAMHRLTAVLLGFVPLLLSAAEPDRNVVTANTVLQTAGLPPLPGAARKLQCYAWSGLSAGVYASWTLEPADQEAYLAQFQGMQTASPIPPNLLSPPNSAAPWFAPAGLSEVWFRGKITRAAPETFRLYGDRKTGRYCLFYTWNNKRTYP